MLRPSTTSEIHNWMNRIGFKLNASETNESNLITEHYFFETFNFFEQKEKDVPGKADFVCFDTYGEKMKVNSLIDLQVAFFENLSVLK